MKRVEPAVTDALPKSTIGCRALVMFIAPGKLPSLPAAKSPG